MVDYISLDIVKAVVKTDLDDTPLTAIMDGCVADVERLAGGRYPVDRLDGTVLDVRATVSGIAAGVVSMRIDSGGWLPARNAPSLHSFSLNIDGTLSVVFRLTSGQNLRTSFLRTSGLVHNVPDDLVWSVVPGAAYESDEWKTEKDAAAKRLILTGALFYADDVSLVASAFAALAVDDEVRLIAAGEPARYFMSIADYEERKVQIVIDLCRILVQDQGLTSSALEVEGFNVRKGFAMLSTEYAARLRQVRYLRGPL